MMSFTNKIKEEQHLKNGSFVYSKPPLKNSLSQQYITPTKSRTDHQRLSSSVKKLSGSTSDLSKSISTISNAFPVENENEPRVYPASCTHTARNRPLGLYIDNSDEEDNAFLPNEVFSASTSDLSSIGGMTNLRGSRKYKSQKNFFSQSSAFRNRKRNSSKRSQSSSRRESSSPTPSDSTFFDTESVTGSISFGKHETEETFYRSFDDLTFDEPLNNGTNFFLSPIHDKCIKATMLYNGDTWRELGNNGGVISIPNFDVVLHVSPYPNEPNKTCQLCSGPVTKHSQKSLKEKPTSKLQERRSSAGNAVARKKMLVRSFNSVRVSGPQLADYNCPVVSDGLVDGRIILALADPADCMMLGNNVNKTIHEVASPLNFQSYIIAGPAVKVHLTDCRSIQAGAVVQLQTNTILRTDQVHVNSEMLQETGQFCKLTCLQSFSFYGPYTELSSCYEYENGLQVTLDTTSLISSKTGKKGCQVHLVPVVAQIGAKSSFIDLWDGVARKTFQIGIYGPKYTYGKNTYCMSISSGGFSPPIMRIQQEKLSHLNLRLLTCYNFTICKIQSFKMTVHTSKSSSLSLATDLSECVITQEEIKTESRINRIFSLKNITSSTSKAQSPKRVSDRRFVVLLSGQKDKRRHKMMCKAPKMSSIEYPHSLSPIVTERLTQEEETSAHALIESSQFDTSFQWLLAQNDAKVRLLAEQFLDSTREVYSIYLAHSLKSTNNKSSGQHTCLLSYHAGEYLPVLSRHKVTADLGNGKKDYWIAYSRHCVGLIRVNAIRVLDYPDFSSWNRVRLSTSKLIEALIDPVEHLCNDPESVREKLLKYVRDWSRFAAVLSFGQPFASSSIEKESNVDVKKEKIKFYLNKYIEYFTNSPKCRTLHREAVRALLYIEQYDAVYELVTDFCILTVASDVSTQWKQLAILLVGKRKSFDSTSNSSSSTSYPQCLGEDSFPAYDFLCYWRKRFENNHKGALLGLYHAATNCLDPASLTLQRLTQCIILVRGIETLCQFDTRL